ncbi:SIMPL domain-containing protein [Ammoniphilus resinae]|uniref:Uncharacterized protein YggE n=1 Tax=Ammoniphilus resinae TaxID=861532 RepID=A0ABS4GIH7_9BACL|nr:SIMPL domain-containing protein [Ammoniphilus resinae]MBP1930060.1 uncharacterized protein YggE [Ammoniphilus resinae]
MKWTKLIAVPVALVLIFGCGLAFSHYLIPDAKAAGTEQINTITVSGKGEITIAPDVAYVQFGLNTEGKTAQEAQQKNAELFSKIQNAIVKQGVQKADIKTVRYYTGPEYQWEKDKNVLKGYRSEHMVEVTYRKMETIGALLDAVTKAGVNRIDNVRFGTEKEEEYEIQALEKAVDNAAKKADALALKAGKTVKGVIVIQESGTSAPPVLYREAAEMMNAKSMAQDQSTSINQGELKFSRQVQVTYEF